MTISKHNIPLLYAVNILKYSWFWIGTWALYYTSFGGYSVLGLLETVMAITGIVFEIPTGAIGDLLGKRWTIALGLLFDGIGGLWMGLAPNVLNLVLSLIIMNIGGALFSGTFEAMIYDSLKQDGEEKKYKRIMNNVSSLTLVMFAICGIASGFIYRIGPGLPYIVTGAFQIIGAIIALFLIEPKIDTEKFSFKSFVKQNLQGFNQLFARKEVRKMVFAFLFVTSIALIIYEGYNDILAVEVGFDAVELGFIWAAMSIVGAISTQFFVKWTEKFDNKKTFIFSIFFYAITLLFSPLAVKGVIVAGLLIRFVFDPIINNEVSDLLNSEIESKHRATSISTFALIKKIPYALVIYLFSASADIISPYWIAFGFGILMVLSSFVNYRVQRNANNTERQK